MNKTWGYLLAATLLAGCGTSGAPKAGADDDKKPTVTVELATVKSEPSNDYVTLQGAFVASEGGLSKLAPAVAGRIGRVLVKEGEEVKKGQLLATLDLSVAQAQENSAKAAAAASQILIRQSDINLRSSKADQRSALETAKIALDQARSESASSVAQAQYTLLQSQADLQKLKSGARPQELAQAHEVTIQASAAKDRAQTELDRDEALSADGYVSKRQLDDARTALQTATSALAAAQDSEQLLKAGARPEELRSAQAKADSAAEALDAAKKSGKMQVSAAQTALEHAQQGILQVAAKEQDVANSKAAAAQRGADLAASAATLGLYRIVAPFDGKIVKRSAAPGDPADPAVPVLSILKHGALTNFVATGLPGQVADLAPAMAVELQSGDQTFTGKVLSVSPADSSGGLASVRISVEGDASPGAFGTARIIVRRHGGLPTVPDTAIVEKDGKEVVYVDVNGVAKQTEVKVGSSSNGKTAIVDGLKAGAQVVASGGNELDDGTNISSGADSGDAKDKDKDKG